MQKKSYNLSLPMPNGTIGKNMWLTVMVMSPFTTIMVVTIKQSPDESGNESAEW